MSTMSKSRSKDRSSDCAFTFADGRRCRMPRKSGHPFLCRFHARKEAQAQAAEEVGRDIRFFLSGDYLSACNLSLALGRVFAAAASGQLKPKTAGTLAYLGQTLLQTIHLAENEYINAFSTDSWRRVIHSHVNENSNYLTPTPPPAPPQAPVHVESGLKFTLRHEGFTLSPEGPGLSDPSGPSTERDLSPAQEPGVSKRADVSAARISSTTDADLIQSASLVSQSAAGADLPAVTSPSPAPTRLPRSAAEFASTILASAHSTPIPSQPLPTEHASVSVGAGLQHGSSSTTASTRLSAQPSSATPEGFTLSPEGPALSSPRTSRPRSSPVTKPAAPSQAPSSQNPKPAATPPTGPSGAPVLAALPPRNPAPRPVRPSDSAL